ncbi:MAG: SNF2-related protein, partial [Sulfurihydrogenibium sp.]
YFYFSGLDVIYEALKQNQGVKVQILVGLDVDKGNYSLYEYAVNKELSKEEKINNFIKSLKTVFNSKEFDTEEFEEKAKFFLQMIEEERLEIRKTREPNHAKLYIMKLEPNQVGRQSLFIVGSSNLTRSGLMEQREYNIEISDFGVEKTEEYFEELWNSAIKITELPERKAKIIKVIKEETPLAQITPYQAYVFSLKHYIDTFYTDKPLEKVKLILEDKGYKVYRYQTDAVSQALQIINDHNGVIIADVVGLGKSIIASALAFVLGEKGIVISPPGLIENWEEYLKDFGLNNLGWKAYSVGKLEDILEIVNNDPEVKVVIVDEAHRFRNEETKSYDLLSKITKGKKVILLTATPFNNRPSDVFSLIKLFQIPKKSTLTLDGKAVNRFKDYENEFSKLVYIKTNYKSHNKKKKELAKKYYKEIFGYETIDIKEVEERLKKLSRRIKNFIQPVVIRRNRLDLRNNPIYSKEVKDLPKVEDPIEVLYGLNKKQSEFYDKVITKYFGEKGEFTGAIYVPYKYKEGFREQEEEKEDFIA